MPDIGGAVPRMKRLGMLEMKPVTIALIEKYDQRFSGGHLRQLDFLGTCMKSATSAGADTRSARSRAR